MSDMNPLPILNPSAGDQPSIDRGSGVCRRLRTKTSFSTYIGSEHFWEEGASSTAVYWCIDTMEAAGPDDHFAHPHLCRDGRSCFRSRE